MKPIDIDFFLNQPASDDSEAYEISWLGLDQQVTFDHYAALEVFGNSGHIKTLTSCLYGYLLGRW